MYIRNAFSIELRLRVSRSLRSLANYIDNENIASQLQCISASVAGTSAIPVTDEQYFSVAM